MRTRLLLWDEEEVRKKKTLVLVLAFLLIPLLLGLYVATGPKGGLIAGATPITLPSPSAIATVTPPVPAFTVTATASPSASATLVAEATATPVSIPSPVPPEPTATPIATLVALEPTPTPPVPTPTATASPSATVTPVAEATATPISLPSPVPPEPTVTPTAAPVALEPTPTPTVVPIATLAAPVITTPLDGSVLKDDRPTIAGTAPPNMTIQVYDDGTPVGAAAADAQGDWTLVTDEPLEPGGHTVTAVASDDAGRTSAPSVAVTFTIIIEHLPVTGSSSWFERWLDRLLSIAFP